MEDLGNTKSDRSRFPALYKALDRIRSVVESGSSYEAQQMYKTAYHRHKAKKQLEESYLVLKEGATVQLRHGQITSGVELGLLLLEAYATENVGPGPQSLAHVCDIIAELPGPSDASAAATASAAASAVSAPAASSSAASTSGAGEGGGGGDVQTANLDECSRFVVAAVKWAQRNKAALAARHIHDWYAGELWKKYGLSALPRVVLHLVRGDDARKFAQVLQTCGEHVLPEEKDLLVTRAVLQVLAVDGRGQRMQQLGLARLLLDESLALRVCDKDLPLVHFTDMLLKALEKSSARLFRLLRDKYAPSLSRDDTLGAYVDKVENVYFPDTNGGAGGLLGGLLKQLGMDNMEEDEEEGEDDDDVGEDAADEGRLDQDQ